MRLRFCAAGGALLAGGLLTAADVPPREWIEPATGHRVVRLSDEDGTASLYFHQNPYTASGDKMIVSTPRGLSTIALATRAIAPLVEGRASHLVVGRKTRQAFYILNGAAYATTMDSGVTRKILEHPRLRTGSGFAINADETMLAGSFVVEDTTAAPPASTGAPPANPLATPPPTGSSLEARWAARRPMALYTLDVRTGDLKIIHRSTDWLNHVQMSPTDPGLIMFCHEGPWHKVDRIWTIRTDGTGVRLMHARTMDMEIAGHEFFAPDGRTIWYDLQTPKGKVFWLAGVEIASGKRTRYSVPREQWSVHFNVSPDGKLFAGDGGGPSSVAAPGNGQWIYLFTPAADGTLAAERLVDLSKHDYRLEPNVTFTPDGKRIVFRSNMHGATHVYAVEIAKAAAGASMRESSRPRDALALQLTDYAALPITGLTDGAGNNAGALARVNGLREEPAPSRRFFANDLTGPLYILNRDTKQFTSYLDLNGRGARSGLFDKLATDVGLASGFISFEFDPDYAKNGRFYTVHLEEIAAPGTQTPDNTSVPGLDIRGYAPTPPVPTPGQVDHEAVVIEWTDARISNATFEGTARELLRVPHNSRVHPMGDLTFNPAARPGDPDWRVLYVACGDGGSGDRKTVVRLNPQRLDNLVGKILRIVPDLSEHTGTSTVSENGRYRIPRDNPFVSIPGARHEIWAYGLRNPHRLNWDVDAADRSKNHLLAANIGWRLWETVVVVHKGANYGFPLREGTDLLQVDGTPGTLPEIDRLPIYVTDVTTAGTVAPTYPVLQYGHESRGGDAIAGGFVYRGAAVPDLRGKYVFGDISTGRVWYADLPDMLAADAHPRTLAEKHELHIWWDDPADAPDRGPRLYPTMAGIVAAGYHARGGKDADLPGKAAVSGSGRVDLRLALDRKGEIYLLSKSDGMIRAVTGVAPVSGGSREAFLRLIDRPRVPLSPEVHAMPGDPAVVREHFTFSSQQGERVPGVLVKTRAPSHRRPAVILLHGTGGDKSSAQIAKLSDALVSRGFIAVAMDGRYHGERVRPGARATEYVSAILRAYRTPREHPFLYDTVWDVMRLIDYLETRPDVDAARIGVMGMSKGGMETYLAAAADPRIAAAVPVIGMQSFRWALDHDAWHSRVGTFRAAVDAAAADAGVKAIDAAFVRRFYDRVVPGIYAEFDAPAMLPLIAPRPLLVINGDSDARTPLEGVQQSAAAAARAYRDAHAADRFVLHIQPKTGHAFGEPAQRAAVEWFVRWLKP